MTHTTKRRAGLKMEVRILLEANARGAISSHGVATVHLHRQPRYEPPIDSITFRDTSWSQLVSCLESWLASFADEHGQHELWGQLMGWHQQELEFPEGGAQPPF